MEVGREGLMDGGIGRVEIEGGEEGKGGYCIQSKVNVLWHIAF